MGLTQRYGRRTDQLAQALQDIAFALGGEAGARLAKKLLFGCPSPDTLLRMIRDTPNQEVATPRCLGVDDWAIRKGRKYRTILVDLERHAVVDLLPDRTSDELAHWLKGHPGVEVITRDRAGSFAEGARQGAPDAIQVADRFHLLQNLSETLKQILQRNPGVLKLPLPVALPTEPGEEAVHLTPEKTEQDVPASLGQRQERYHQVRELHRQGKKLREIATSLGIAVNTAMKYVQLPDAPKKQMRSTRKTSGFESYITQRWMAGVREAMQIFQELQSRGYRGSYQTVARYVANLRTIPAKALPSHNLALPQTPKMSVSKAVWVLGKPAEKLDDDEKKLVVHLCSSSDQVSQAYELAQSFQTMVRKQQADQLENWLSRAKSSQVPSMRNFATSLRKDQEAVGMALALPWNSGQVEGQINRLKLIKRQMQGRAKLDLLRQRVVTPN